MAGGLKDFRLQTVLYVSSFQWKSRIRLSEKPKAVFWYQVAACLPEHGYAVVLMNELLKLAEILCLPNRSSVM